MKILIINGSHRDGNTDIIVKKIIEEFNNRTIEIRELILRKIEMRLPDGCEQCAKSEICPHIKDQFSKEIEPTIRNYDIYIIVTPTWDDGVTPLTKIFWDRIVSWCNKKRLYLKNKKLAIITHGMADENSWNNVINWVKSICIWERCKFGGSLTTKSGGKIGDIKIEKDKIKRFILNLIN
ncbi:MAG: flavodoxin family protein [Candidatus Kuenenbacteria bacterium]